LDGLEPDARMAEALSVRGSCLGKLYDAAALNARVGQEDFVPPDAPASATFIFEGRNSLPAFSRFQKWFARVSPELVIGHNHQPYIVVSGPGYFAFKPPSATADVADEPYFDYTQAPEHVPTGWPRYRPNDWGPSLIVFAGLKDYLRRVARGVVVGKAFRKGTDLKQYFILARAD